MTPNILEFDKNSAFIIGRTPIYISFVFLGCPCNVKKMHSGIWLKAHSPPETALSLVDNAGGKGTNNMKPTCSAHVGHIVRK